MQERHNSIANALELRLSCTNLSILECAPLLLLEIVDTTLRHAIMYISHCLDHLTFDLRTAFNVKLRQEVIRHSHQCLFRPTLEPVHGATRDETRELQRTTAEFLTHLELTRYAFVSNW